MRAYADMLWDVLEPPKAIVLPQAPPSKGQTIVEAVDLVWSPDPLFFRPGWHRGESPNALIKGIIRATLPVDIVRGR